MIFQRCHMLLKGILTHLNFLFMLDSRVLHFQTMFNFHGPIKPQHFISGKTEKCHVFRSCLYSPAFCGNPSRGGHAPLQLEWGINNLGSAVNHAIKLSVVLTFWHNPSGGSLVRPRATLAFVLGDNRAFSAAIMASSIKDDTDIHQLPPSPRTAAMQRLSLNMTPIRILRCA